MLAVRKRKLGRLDGYGPRLPVLRVHGEQEQKQDEDDEKKKKKAPYVMWPATDHGGGCVQGRAAYFSELSNSLPETAPSRQASSLADLMNIRAVHSKSLHRRSLGTALGFRTCGSRITDVPAIIVFVARKLHRKWIMEEHLLPRQLQGAAGVWCDVDVVEFSYYGVTTDTPRERLYSEIVENVRGNDTQIGSGSQVASVEAYGTLGALVRSRGEGKHVGFITNRHVAVDFDFPNQKMFHPLPPSRGQGVYLGSVERAASFITDRLWFGMYASSNSEAYVRADGAFVAFAEQFDTSKLTTRVRGLQPSGVVGEVIGVDLGADVSSLVGKQVVKLGRSSGLTQGMIVAYAVEYNDDKGNSFFTDFLIVGETCDQQLPFDLEGDSGSMIMMSVSGDQRPLGMLWGGTANRGRLKLRSGTAPENWTSAVDLGRLLNLLNLDLITTQQALDDALKEQGELQAAS